MSTKNRKSDQDYSSSFWSFVIACAVMAVLLIAFFNSEAKKDKVMAEKLVGQTFVLVVSGDTGFENALTGQLVARGAAVSVAPSAEAVRLFAGQANFLSQETKAIVGVLVVTEYDGCTFHYKVVNPDGSLVSSGTVCMTGSYSDGADYLARQALYKIAEAL